MSEAKQLLVVDDDPDMRLALQLTLRKAGYDCTLAADGQEALDLLRRRSFDLVVTDLRMPRVGGIELLERMSAAAPHTPALVITAHGSVDAAVESMKLGALDFLQKPFGPEVLLAKISSVLARATPRPRGRPKTAFVAEDPAMEPVLALIEAAAATRATVLITGESGTGKEVVARRIHELSPWADGPFVGVNCAAVPANLMESELFGHEKGAFTGATEARPGRFEQAQGGTILLDEVSEMEPALQAKLLRVLQEREVERVGGRKPIPLELRVVATTNRDLPEEVRRGRFREDLFYRLQVIPIEVPPLRRRPRDIVPLARHFLERARRAYGLAEAELTAEAERALASHDWPGNVRELQNTVERAAVISRGGPIRPEHLLLGKGAVRQEGELRVDGTLEEMERRIILAAFEQHGRNKKATARALGINVKTLRAKLKAYGVGGEGDEEDGGAD
ncbi:MULTISPECIES: sigma-54-dependent transcriptional regulator [Deferrisoma]